MTDLPVNHKPEWMLSLPGQKAQEEHLEWIGGRVVTLLNHYWRDDDPAEMTGAIGRDWADVLEGLPQDAIQKACIRYQREEPRRKPTPGAIYAMARDFMPRPKIVHSEKIQEPPRVMCSKKEAQAMCDAAGYSPKRFGEKNDV